MPQGRSVVGFIGLGDNDGRGMSHMRALPLCAVLATLLYFGQAAAQQPDWPGSKPIRFEVTAAAGGLPDIVLRTLSTFISTSAGVPVIVGRAPGAISRPPLSPRPRPTGTRSWSPGLIKPSIRRFCPIPALTTSAISRRYRWSCKPKCCLWPAPAFLVTTSPTSSGSRRKNRNRSASQFQRSARPIISARKC